MYLQTTGRDDFVQAKQADRATGFLLVSGWHGPTGPFSVAEAGW
jgi:hypothetical protein